MGFGEAPVAYAGPTQKARIWTEAWVAEQMFCPNCGVHRIEQHKANNPAADFFCRECREEFELKSQRARFGRRIVDGALKTMMGRVESGKAPNLLLLNYDRAQLAVANLIVIPRQFLTPAIIEARPPLGPHARRAGWQGCNILISEVPDAGKVWLVKNGVMSSRDSAIEDWHRTLFLREATATARGWLIEVMKCVEEIGRAEFDLADVYAFESRLSALYPENENVRPKIRQQLQVLRGQGFLRFLGSGRYSLRKPG